MRMFVAVVPPPEVLDHLDAFLEPRRAYAGFRWTRPDQVHLTLAFLGDVRDRHLDELEERLTRAAVRRSAFGAAISGGGAFPDVATARVLWAGLSADVPLEPLATGARTAAATSGIAVDGQRFRPHLTVARLGHPEDVTRWVRLLDAYEGPRWTADRLTLVESHLGEGRPRYEVAGEYPLG